MDADSKERLRERNLSSRRSHRYSMDTQRFDEILAEITAGYNNIRNSFENVKIEDILEEILTDYVRQALETDAAPNFSEVAVLLQHCANLYGRKVDYLYQQVVDVSESLAVSAPEPTTDSTSATPGTPGGSRRRRRTSHVAPTEFAHIKLTECSSARRPADTPRPPPTLPRMYIELEPRVMPPHLEPLRDYNGEPIGMPSDFHVTWRTQDGFLVDELEMGGYDSTPALRPLSLVELQAAIEAAAPPSPPATPRPCTPSAFLAPLCTSTPLPGLMSPPPPPPPEDLLPVAIRKTRKRKSSTKVEELLEGSFRSFITKEVKRKLRKRAEYAVDAEWISQVVKRRARRLLGVRLNLDNVKQFFGFDYFFESSPGFVGWTAAEGVLALAAATESALSTSQHVTSLESDDDGFYSRSSFSCSSGFSNTDYFALPDIPQQNTPAACEEEASRREGAAAEASAWTAAVAARAAASEASGGVDVRALGARVLQALPPAPLTLPFPALLQSASRADHDVSRLLLASLFLSNSGNVEITQGPPLSVGQFSLTLLSTDERLYSAAAAADAEYFA